MRSHNDDLLQGLKALSHRTSSLILLEIRVTSAGSPMPRKISVKSWVIYRGWTVSLSSTDKDPAFLVTGAESSLSTFICDKNEANSLRKPGSLTMVEDIEIAGPGYEHIRRPVHPMTAPAVGETSNDSNIVRSFNFRMMTAAFCARMRSPSISEMGNPSIAVKTYNQIALPPDFISKRDFWITFSDNRERSCNKHSFPSALTI